MKIQGEEPEMVEAQLPQRTALNAYLLLVEGAALYTVTLKVGEDGLGVFVTLGFWRALVKVEAILVICLSLVLLSVGTIRRPRR